VQNLQCASIVALFNNLYFSRYNTRLLDGSKHGYDEPEYIAPRAEQCGNIVFAHGFIRSALHEVAHWCHAGPTRRQSDDYGYWYLGDERTQIDQERFEQVELVPQAYELILCQALELHFAVSLDNFNSNVVLDRARFEWRVRHTARQRQINGLPQRLALFEQGLRDLAHNTEEVEL